MRTPARSLVLLAAFVLGCATSTTAIVSPSASLVPPPPVAVESAPARADSPSVEGMRIRVPRLGIDLPLAEGDLARDIPGPTGPGATPEGAAFHLPGSAVPGHAGNAYIYAHARVGMFLSLWQTKVGDEVDIDTAAGVTLRYRVSEVHASVPSSDVSWVRPTNDERLTLQTSTGPTPAYPRFIVVATRS